MPPFPRVPLRLKLWLLIHSVTPVNYRFFGSSKRSDFSIFVFALLTFALAACDSNNPNDGPDGPVEQPGELVACELPENQIVNGGPGKDGIPALTNPTLIPVEQIGYMADDDRVIGIMIDGEPVAVPHNILWWHEIANFSARDSRVAATYCPLTGSSIVFDRANINDAELGVSGLLYQNNLIMYDRNEDEALWSQILTGASCNSDKGVALTTIAHIEMSWAGWKALYPNSQALSSATGFTRNYTRYPYSDYENLDNSQVLFQMRPLDTRRPPKERALGIPDVDGSAIVFPFGVLDAQNAKNVIITTFKNRQIVVLWDPEKEAAAAFEPITTNGAPVNLVVETNQFVDVESGAIFEVNGAVMEGDMAGTQLRSVPEAYVAFWFAWPAFHPDVSLYDPTG